MSKKQGEINELCDWINGLPLTREIHFLHRDISDGEIVYSYVPNIVDLHNYSPANSVALKIYNWNTLNRFQLSDNEIRELSSSNSNACVKFVKQLKDAINNFLLKSHQIEVRNKQLTTPRSKGNNNQDDLDNNYNTPTVNNISVNKRSSIINNSKSFKRLESFYKSPKAIKGREDTIFIKNERNDDVEYSKVDDKRTSMVNTSLHKDKQIKQLIDKNYKLEKEIEKLRNLLKQKDNQIEELTQHLKAASKLK